VVAGIESAYKVDNADTSQLENHLSKATLTISQHNNPQGGGCAMKSTNHTQTIQLRTSFILLIAIAACALCGTSSAQTVIGSAGAGWQTWTLSDVNDLGGPYWDTQWGGSQPNSEHSAAEKNVGFCMTSTGDCQGIGSALLAPGTLPFWGMPYNSTTDTGGVRDNNVFLKSRGGKLRATLYLNASGNPVEINEIGWFETNSAGSVIGTKHLLFEGTGPNENLTPDPVGATVTFTPTQYFGYYYADVSEGNCYTYTLFNFNDPNCAGAGNNHDFVIFTTNPSSSHATMWIAGEDPADCPNNDGDCNLTIIKVSNLESD
jgi:hypothetical protein